MFYIITNILILSNLLFNFYIYTYIPKYEKIYYIIYEKTNCIIKYIYIVLCLFLGKTCSLFPSSSLITSCCDCSFPGSFVVDP